MRKVLKEVRLMVRVLLALFSNNFFSYANYFMLFLLVYETVWIRHIKLVKVRTSCLVWLLLASATYFGISMYNGQEFTSSTFALRFISPVVLFYVGYTRGLLGYESVKTDVIVLMAATFVHGFMNVIVNRDVNVLMISGRQYQDIYGGFISATLQNLMFVLSSALLFYFLQYENKKCLKCFGLFAAIGGAYGSIANASRTLLYVLAIVFVICLFIYLVLTHDMASGIIRGLLIVCGLVAITLLVMWLDLFGIQEWFANTALGQRKITSSVSQNLRWQYASDILRLLPSFPFGKMEYTHYAHNLWVDIARETGIIPFVFYTIFSIASVIEVVRFCYQHKKCSEKVVFISAVIVAYCLVFFTEPIMEGSPISFSIFCFIVGGYLLWQEIQKNWLWTNKLLQVDFKSRYSPTFSNMFGM